MRGHMVGTVDLGNVDLGNVEGRDRAALARVLGVKTYRDASGKWRLQGGVVDGVRLDHPTVLRVLGEPLEPVSVPQWEPLRDNVQPSGAEVPANWEPGQNVMAWFYALADEVEVGHAAAVIDEYMTGVPAGLYEGATVALDLRLRDTLRYLILSDMAEDAAEPAAPAEPEPASVPAEQPAPVEMVEPTPAPQEKPRYRLHLDGTFEHLSGPVLDVPEHRRHQPSAAPVSAEVPASVSGSPEPVSVPSVAPMSAPVARTKRRAPVRPVRGVVACHEFSGPGVAA